MQKCRQASKKVLFQLCIYASHKMSWCEQLATWHNVDTFPNHTLTHHLKSCSCRRLGRVGYNFQGCMYKLSKLLKMSPGKIFMVLISWYKIYYRGGGASWIWGGEYWVEDQQDNFVGGPGGKVFEGIKHACTIACRHYTAVRSIPRYTQAIRYTAVYA